MGAWGAGIFADDDAADLRGEYRILLADAQSDTGATDAAALSYNASFDRLDDSTGFWLALALIQWKLGRLDPRVKAAALRIIDNGLDLAKWENSPLRGKRAIALRKARETITAPLPEARPMPKTLPVQLPGWEFGEVIGYRMPNNKFVLLHVIGYHAWSLLGVKAPYVTILSWFQETVPTQDDVSGLTYINHGGRMPCQSLYSHHLLCLAMPRRQPLAAEQFTRAGWARPVTRSEASSAIYGIRADCGSTLNSVLGRVLSPYWEDPTRPPHLPKELPLDDAARAAVLQEIMQRMFGNG